jgi:glycosyltransferase involved in cell wall biosynthesis
MQRSHYSWFRDRSADLYSKKKEALLGLDMTVITPSQWLADQVKQSFLKEYPVKVIYNGIDLSVFYPRESDFRQKYHLENRHIVLGVAFGWGPRKGLDVFAELAERLGDAYQIVLVGTNDAVDRQLPATVISIHRTQNQTELAEIYSAADVFINPTREEVLGLTNIESCACGTPVVTFATGGSAETIHELSGCSVPKDHIDALESQIRRICESKPYTVEDCVARAGLFDANARFRDYVELYCDLMNNEGS